MSILGRQYVEREARARRELEPEDYDRELCFLLDEIGSHPQSEERMQVLLALARAALLGGDRKLVAFRACCAEHLLSNRSLTSDPKLRGRGDLLFLLAWLQLDAVIEGGPESITRSPPLPEGVVLPHGADPEAITDPNLRAQARELRKQYDEEVERWRAKHLALDKQILLATLVRAAGREKPDDNELRILAAAMALAPGLPLNVRTLLEDFARES